jgi:hypothetical protein
MSETDRDFDKQNGSVSIINEYLKYLGSFDNSILGCLTFSTALKNEL